MASSSQTTPDASSLEQTFWVKPSTPVPASKTLLPAADQVGVPIVLPRICCFTRDDSLSEEHFIEAIKIGTAGAIAELPHLCGKISVADPARRRYQLEIPEDTSVLVKIKWHPGETAEEYARQSWAPHLMLREKLTLSKYPIKGVGTYNFAVQANMIQGGVILALHMNHLHFDGYAHALIELVFAHFLSRAIERKPATPSGIIVPEALDKSVAWGSHPARPVLDWPDWRQAPPPMKLDGYTEEQLSKLYVASMADFTLTVWSFSPQSLDRIRRDGQEPGSDKKLSLASCLHSFLWKALVRSRKQDLDTTTMCLTPVQTRGRVRELHQMWSGSALVYSRAKATIRELMSVPNYDLGRRLEAGVARWTPQVIREYWGSLEDCDDLSSIQPNTDRQNGPDIELSNISNLPFHRISWGKGLTVAAWRCTDLAFTDGYVIVAPKLRNGNIETFLWMHKDSVATLLEDKEWRNTAEYVCANTTDMDAQVANSGWSNRAKL